MNGLVKRSLAVAVLLSGVFWACDRAPAPSEPELAPRAALSGEVDVTPLARFVDGAPAVSKDNVQVTIGSAGGSLALAGFEVVVPAGAVAEPTVFQIDLKLGTAHEEYVYAEFLPHGIRFEQPVTLRLPYRGTTAEGNESRVLWWDDARWVPFETTITEDGRLETRTDHFSEYGSEEERGITIAGG